MKKHEHINSYHFIHCIAFGEVIIFVAVINVTTIENNLVF